jgi:hypothetical protein
MMDHRSFTAEWVQTLAGHQALKEQNEMTVTATGLAWRFMNIRPMERNLNAQVELDYWLH